MRRIETFLAFLLIALGLYQVPAFTVYSCRKGGEIHATCCCSSKDRSLTEADCSCCDVLKVEIKASVSPSPSCPGPESVPVLRAMGQELSDRSALRSDARFSHLDPSAQDLSPPPRIALCIQRI